MSTDTSMPMNVATETGRIVLTPGTCGGKPRVAGTRIRVKDVYWWHEVEGKSADEIVTSFPQLSMADVYAALSYFWSHRDELLAELQQERLHYEEMKRSQHSLVSQKLKELGQRDAEDNSISS
jgi:uncharacterized protein (DUF433 family)